MEQFAVGTRVRLNAGGRALQRRLTAYGGDGVVYTADGGPIAAAEVDGGFEVLGNDGGRDTFVRSLVSGREGRIGTLLLRLERPQDRARG
jgi:hypothetical protein